MGARTEEPETSKKRYTSLVVLALLAAIPAVGQSRASWPTNGWKSSTPEAQGIDASVLDELDEELASGRHGYIDGMLVIRHGSIVYEKHYTQGL